MGTRNLTMVTVDGKRKVAQYCQWDGYPGGVGKDIAAFLDGLRGNALEGFKNRVRELGWASPAEVDAAWKKNGANDSGMVGMGTSDKAKENIPEFHRDTGPGILGLIAQGKVKRVQDNSSFLNDGLFCEWAYEIDLDKESVSIYKSGKLFKTISFAKFTVKSMVEMKEE